MKRILFILLVVTASTTVMAGMSTSKVRKETRFLTDKMAYELDLNNPQYNDTNYRFCNGCYPRLYFIRSKSFFFRSRCC